MSEEKAFQPEREEVTIKGQKVIISELSGEEAIGLAEGKDYIYRLLAKSIVDKDGKRRFSDKPEDIAIIKTWGQSKLRKMINVAMRLNGLDDEQEKNSGAGPSAG
jgi:hypothetical protein